MWTWLTSILTALTVTTTAADMAPVGPGTHRPLYPATPEVAAKGVPVAAFRLDRTPVTNGDFLAFVKKHPKWRRDRVARLFADSSYLAHWAGPETPGVDPKAPVTRVSWFAAKAYCAAQGKRLPTEDEWELAAAASETAADGRADPAWTQKILDWYARPNEARPVGQGPANFWGVHDLHGHVWEWVYDFNAAMVANDRDASARFCGAAAVSAQDKNDYASFMRLAFRSSLRADYTTANLGFRCAADAKGSVR
jgi:formylglycine-generating enzyme required for sulfatase activity